MGSASVGNESLEKDHGKCPGRPAKEVLRHGVVIVSHDANRTGAPLIALNIARTLVEENGIPIVTVLLRTGELEQEFLRLGPVFVVPQDRSQAYHGDPRPWARLIKRTAHKVAAVLHGNNDRFWLRLARYLASRQIRHAICNTVLSGVAAGRLKEAGVRSIGLVHEMPHSIRTYGWKDETVALIRAADALVFACSQVRTEFVDAFPTGDIACHVFPQGCNIQQDQLTGDTRSILRATLRARLGLSVDDILILGCGYGDFRKGIDLFVQTAREMIQSFGADAGRKITFAWAGLLDGNFEAWAANDIRKLGLADRLVFLGQQRNMAPCFAAADIFFLPSREDPFPTVVLEAMASALPVVGFLRSGGFAEQACGGAGVAVPYADTGAAAKVLRRLIENSDERIRMGQSGRTKISVWGGYRNYVTNLIGLLESSPEVPARNSSHNHCGQP